MRPDLHSADPSDALHGFLAWLAGAPDGTLLPAEQVRSRLRDLLQDGAPRGRRQPDLSSWRERLWTADDTVRIGVKELAAAVGHSASWIWRRTAPKDGSTPLPHRKREGELVFLVGEVRTWLTQQESAPSPTLALVPGSPSAPKSRRGGR